MFLAALILAACSSWGCHTLSDAECKAIGVNAAAGKADVRRWDAMTPEQKRAAIVATTASFVALDYSANGVEPGPEWRAILDAPNPASAPK